MINHNMTGVIITDCLSRFKDLSMASRIWAILMSSVGTLL